MLRRARSSRGRRRTAPAIVVLTLSVVVGVLMAPATASSQPATTASAREATPARAVARLGLHDYQHLDAGDYLRAPGVAPMSLRSVCQFTMATPRSTLIAYARDLRAARSVQGGIFGGCGATPGSWKYRSGPMSGTDAIARKDVLWRGAAATPKVAAYTAWLRDVAAILGPQLRWWEVWNEGELGPFYRGTPNDLVDLTFAAARVLGRSRVTAPSFSTGPYYWRGTASGAWVGGRFLTKGQFFREYWRLLIKRANQRGVRVPIAAANLHGHGRGNTIAQAADSRLDMLRMFRTYLQPVARRYGFVLWDSEWSLRRINGATGPIRGFADNATNAAWLERSLRDAACLGYGWQYYYTWTQGIKRDDFVRSTLQVNPGTRHVNQVFRRYSGPTPLGCRAGVVGPSRRPLPSFDQPAVRTRITGVPARRITAANRRTTLTFKFRSAVVNAGFKCRLDSVGRHAATGRWQRCASGVRYRVGGGRYLFSVRVRSGRLLEQDPPTRLVRVSGRPAGAPQRVR